MSLQPSDKSALTIPSINIQNSTNLNGSEETYYGRFRTIVKQRYFGIKLEEHVFMEFIDSNPEMKETLGEFTNFMNTVKDDYIAFLRKNYPNRIEKKKNKKKGKKKDSGVTLEVPRLDSDCYSSDGSGIYSLSRDELETTTTSNELANLRKKIESIKNDFTFSSIENVAKNIHLFDDFFGKIKTDHTNRQRMDQLKQLSFLNIGVGPTEGGISFASFGNAAGGGESQGQIEDFPKSFEYFSELYTRWDQVHEEEAEKEHYE